MIENIKTVTTEHKTSKIIYLIFYLIPFVYIDMLGITLLLSATGLTMLMHSQFTDTSKRDINKKSILLLLVSVFIAYVTMFLFINDKFDKGFSIGGFEILPSYTFLFYYLFPLLWAFFLEKETLKSFIRVDRKFLLYMALLCLPIIATNSLWVFDQVFFDLNYSINDSLKEVYQAFIIAAIAEELFFRGFVYNSLKKVVTVPTAQVLSSIIFAFWHFSLIKSFLIEQTLNPILNMVEIFVLGLVLSFIYERSKSLISSILFHGFIDGGFKFALLALFIIQK
ncbi:MAG TPA: type II CAAX endopeptidase family protein [Pseudobacteroides sp.]|uniref:CPBP family intramembrane glutamic endopeptidase n=1 Tax=Pseudobacteroides sp. TaxID=1968840 RepID=UPI002F950C8E